MQGYYKKPEATKMVIDEEGWFHTGDLGHMEENIFWSWDEKRYDCFAEWKNINPGDIESELFKLTDFVQDIAVMEYEKIGCYSLSEF